MDGVRELIYDQPERPSDPYDGALLLNQIVREEARALDVPFVDLHEAFGEAYRVSQARFEYPCDGHWNERGHAVAARTIHEQLLVRESSP